MDNEVYLRTVIEDIAKEQLRESDFIVTISNSDESGNGFFGDIVKVKVEGQHNTLNIVVKVSIKNDKVRVVCPVDEAYNNEQLFYRHIFPAMKTLQEELNIKDVFNSVPKFFTDGNNGDRSYIFMEDLMKSGFTMVDLKKNIDDDHISEICRVFGRFHALSFALKHLKPDLYSNYTSKLQCVHMGFLRYKGGFLKQCVSIIQQALNENSSNRMIDYYVENIVNVYKNILFDSKRDKYSCLIHYDGWLNNLMFKYGDSNGEKTVEEIKLFDWQTCNVGSPAVDLSIVLYTIASKQILDNLEKYLKIYHDALEKFLVQTGLKIEDVYPFEVLKDQWKRYCEYGLTRAFLVHKIRLNVGTADNFESAINAEFNVGEMKELLDNLYEHLRSIGVY